MAVDWDSPEWGGRVHVAASDDLGKHGRHAEDAEDDQ